MATGYSDFKGNALLSIVTRRHAAWAGPQPTDRKASTRLSGKLFSHRPSLPATKASHSEFQCVNLFSKIGTISDSRNFVALPHECAIHLADDRRWPRPRCLRGAAG